MPSVFKTQPKALETFYDGYRFRSRLEARYAVFFNSLGIEYRYEYQGYGFYGVCYLPDFWLPEQKRWIEIKGQKPTDAEIDRADNLHYHTGYPVIVFHDEPGRCKAYAIYGEIGDSGGTHCLDTAEWGICRGCQKVDINLRTSSYDLLNFEVVEAEDINYCHCPSPEWDTKHPRLLEAYAAARQARFEFGETTTRVTFPY